MIISPSRRFIFVHIHKAGGTSIERVYAPFRRWDDLLFDETPLGLELEAALGVRFGLGKHSSLEQLRAALGADFDKFRTLALVRAPVPRAVSLFNFAATVVAGLPRRHALFGRLTGAYTNSKHLLDRFPELRWPAVQAFLEGGSFSGFLRHPVLMREPGFETQTERLSVDGVLAVDDFFRLEEIDRSAPSILGLMGLPAGTPMPHENRSKVQIAPANISAEDRRLIAERFAADYENFGYKSED